MILPKIYGVISGEKDDDETVQSPLFMRLSATFWGHENKTICHISRARKEENKMAIITPDPPATASLSMPLVTPGWPMVGVEKSNPAENATGKNDGVSPAVKRANAVHQSGHDGDRSL